MTGAAGWTLSLAAGLLLGCGVNEPTYFPPPGPLEAGAEGGMPGAASVVMDLPFRSPNADEAAKRAEQSQNAGFEVPWLPTDQVAISVLYTITNLSDRIGDAHLRIDGASEFASYDPAALQAAAIAIDPEDDELPMSLIQPKPPRLGPGQSYRGVVREDDFTEAALDLDAIGRFGAVPESVLVNVSSANPIGLEMVPAGDVYVRPALFRLQVSFTASTHMRLEFLVRVRDQGDRLAGGDATLFTPDPRGYTPPPPPPPMP